jgi:hypothetical protein
MGKVLVRMTSTGAAGDRRPPARRRVRRVGALLGLAALAAVLAVIVSGTGSGRRPPAPTRAPATARGASIALGPKSGPPRGRPVSVRVGGGSPGRAVPSDFLGLSIGMAFVPGLARDATRGNLVQLMRSLGPGVLRLSETDYVAYSPDGHSAPAWAAARITPRDLDGLGLLARRAGWRVLVAVNLAHYDPGAAGQLAAAAARALGSRLAGIELGNEPDRYAITHERGTDWSFAAYAAQVRAYRAAIGAKAPGVPIVGPDASSGVPPLAWVEALARSGPAPAVLTDHFYPLTLCGGTTVTVEDLLSGSTRRAASAMLSTLRSVQSRSGIPLRLDESNNVSCNGAPGVSTSFASALWAVDYVVRTMRAGLAGVNLMDRIERLVDPPKGAYSPLAVSTPRARQAGAMTIYPEWYALLLVRQLLGERPARVSVASGAAQLTAAAFAGPGRRLDVVLDDFDPPGSPPLRVKLGGAASVADGGILRLQAPSPRATRGVTLGGRAVSASGSWAPPPTLPRVYRRGRLVELEMQPTSAALVTLIRSSGR